MKHITRFVSPQIFDLFRRAILGGWISTLSRSFPSEKSYSPSRLMCCQEITEPWATASRNTCRLAAWEASSQGCVGTGMARSANPARKDPLRALGCLAQTLGKPPVSTARHGARTLWGRLFARTRENMLPEQTSAGRASGGTGGWKPT